MQSCRAIVACCHQTLRWRLFSTAITAASQTTAAISGRHRPPRAAFLLVNKLKGESCTSNPVSQRAEAGQHSSGSRGAEQSTVPSDGDKPQDGDVASGSAPRPKRPFADPGTGFSLMSRLRLMGVLDDVTRQIAPKGGPGQAQPEQERPGATAPIIKTVKASTAEEALRSLQSPSSTGPSDGPTDKGAVKWTIAASLDTPSEGLVLLASHGWLAEYVRRFPAQVATITGKKGERPNIAAAAPQASGQATITAGGGPAPGSSAPVLCEYKVRVRGRLRTHALKSMARGGLTVDGVPMPRVRVVEGTSLEEQQHQGRQAAGTSAGTDTGPRQRDGSDEGLNKPSDGPGSKHNGWYTMQTLPSRSGRGDDGQGPQAAARVGTNSTSTRALRQLLSHFGCPANRVIRTAYGPFTLGTVPNGSALHVPAPRALVLAAWEWAHGDMQAGQTSGRQGRGRDAGTVRSTATTAR